jgi:hypothetical protein
MEMDRAERDDHRRADVGDSVLSPELAEQFEVAKNDLAQLCQVAV